MEQVNKRINFKDITVGTRKFRLNKFDALTGSYILFKIVGMLTPIFKDIFKEEDVKKAKENLEKGSTDITGEDIAKILGEITKLPKEDFDYIQKNCLMVINEIHGEGLPVSPPVLDEFGTFGIQDADVSLIMNLTIQSLVFNVSGFFPESLSGLNLEGLTTSLQGSLM